MAPSSKSTISNSKSATAKASATNGAGGKGKTAALGGGGGGGKQKRSPWDLKGRLQDMEVLMADERKFSTNTIGDLQTQVCKLASQECKSIYSNLLHFLHFKWLLFPE